MEKIIDPNICGWDTAYLLIFSDNVFGDFIYYSHIFPALTALVLGFFIFKHNKTDIVSRLFLLLSIAFFLWSFFDLILWATEKTHYIMFFWSSLIYLDILIYVFGFYFVYAFLFSKLPSWRIDLITLILFIPLILFAHTSLNLTAFDFTNCWREALEGPLWQFYVYNVEIGIALAILGFGMYALRKSSGVKRLQNLFVIMGMLVFLFMFSFGNIAGSINVDWELGQYGLFGMTFLAAILAYLIARYKAFNTSALTSEILITAISLLILALLFVRQIENIRVITVVTLVLTIIMGTILIRNNKREIEQKERIEQLAKTLESANARLKELDRMKSEFVSIASHQLRGPLTAIRGYASMLSEGTYGTIPEKAREILDKIVDSGKFMAFSIEDYLNVSRIEVGNMKYEYSDFNIKEQTEKIVDELRQTAIKKGLVMMFRSECTGSAMVHADIGKVRQVIMNLVDNSIKYTPSGTVTVIVHDDVVKKKVRVTIHDTGIGMDAQTISELFEKFVRAKNANSVNVTGTGLGLYVAKKMVNQMGGKVWAESEGPGKGSQFHLEFKMLPGNPTR